jgi:predicted secreted hydrolase
MWRWMFLALILGGAFFPTLSMTAHAGGASTPFLIAKPNHAWQFPDDHGEHPDYASEWWYTTGHLNTPWQAFQSPQQFGYEATLFRIARPAGVRSLTLKASEWKPQQLYMIHVALSDITGKHFYYSSAYERQNPFRKVVQVEPWRLMAKGLTLKAHQGANNRLPIWDLNVNDTDFSLDLRLVPQKDKVFHGTKNGYSKKGSCASCASMYYSFTDLFTSGKVTLKDAKKPESPRSYKVFGKSWFDHEFGSSQLTKTQVGWDWFAIQLDNHHELMLYFMREKDGSISLQSGGTWVDTAGKVTRLTAKDLDIKVLSRWKSPRSKVLYPSAWALGIASLKLKLSVTPTLADQELYFPKQKAFSYWEGASFVKGTLGKNDVQGKAYVELAGYASKLSF